MTFQVTMKHTMKERERRRQQANTHAVNIIPSTSADRHMMVYTVALAFALIFKLIWNTCATVLPLSPTVESRDQLGDERSSLGCG